MCIRDRGEPPHFLHLYWVEPWPRVAPSEQVTLMVIIKKLGAAVPGERVHARIGKPDLEFIARGGIVALCGVDILPQPFEKHLSFPPIAFDGKEAALFPSK